MVAVDRRVILDDLGCIGGAGSIAAPRSSPDAQVNYATLHPKAHAMAKEAPKINTIIYCATQDVLRQCIKEANSKVRDEREKAPCHASD